MKGRVLQRAEGPGWSVWSRFEPVSTISLSREPKMEAFCDAPGSFSLCFPQILSPPSFGPTLGPANYISQNLLPFHFRLWNRNRPIGDTYLQEMGRLEEKLEYFFPTASSLRPTLSSSRLQLWADGPSSLTLAFPTPSGPEVKAPVLLAPQHLIPPFFLTLPTPQQGSP